MSDIFLDWDAIELGENQFLAQVVEVHKGGAFVISCDIDRNHIRGDIWYVKVRKKFMNRSHSRSFQNFLAVGDFVICLSTGTSPQKASELPVAMVTRVFERHNSFCRSSGGRHQSKQVIASNYDQLFILTSILTPDIKWQMLDAYLASLEGDCEKVFMVFTKTDLIEKMSEQNRQEFIQKLPYYRKLGIEVSQISLVDGVLDSEGLKLLSKLQNKVNVFVGLSGVGKSSLINCCEPELVQEVGVISEGYGGGRHTTTGVRLLFTEDYGTLIDTPGVRSWRLDYMNPRQLAESYSDILELSQQCKFRDCLHVKEIGCGVKQSIGTESLPEWRYESYLKHFESIRMNS